MGGVPEIVGKKIKTEKMRLGIKQNEGNYILNTHGK